LSAARGWRQIEIARKVRHVTEGAGLIDDVGFTVAHQYLHQLDPDVRHAVLGNAGTIIAFRVGAEDAPYLEREFQQRFDQTDVTQLGNYQTYLKLMIEGMPSKPFSAVTLPPEA
jgi:hypothetical protein